ncbi:MAG: hypothetical protein WAS21_27940 [Geminicoccaceae bacterium]
MTTSDGTPEAPREFLPTSSAEVLRQDAVDRLVAGLRGEVAYWKARWSDEAALAGEREQELAALRHDIDRHLTIAASLATENDELRRELATLRGLLPGQP